MLRLGQMVLSSPGQVNFLLPAATASGTVEVIFTSGSGATSRTTVEVSTLAPAIFTAPGTTVAAATAVSVAADGTQTPVTVVECGASGSCSAVPVDLGPPGQSVFVTFFGTGLRKNSGVSERTRNSRWCGRTRSFCGIPGPVCGPGSDKCPIAGYAEGSRSGACCVHYRWADDKARRYIPSGDAGGRVDRGGQGSRPAPATAANISRFVNRRRYTVRTSRGGFLPPVQVVAIRSGRSETRPCGSAVARPEAAQLSGPVRGRITTEDHGSLDHG